MMIPIDGLQAGVKADPKILRANAEAVASMMGAVPHLFPPNTNLYDPKAVEPVTLAMPAIWQNFDGFYALAGATVTAAHAMAAAEGKDAQREASLELRASCDACHAANLRPYKPSTVQPSDKDLDVDALLK
jgi:cytochrome c556